MDANQYEYIIMIQNNRFLLIDFIRGIAVVTMIIFHFFYILDFFVIKENQMYEGYFLILARFTQITFLSLVGISLAVSKHFSKKQFVLKQYKRAFLIALCAIMVSLGTYLFLGNEIFVRFGILHLISVSIFICAYFADKKFLSLFLGILIFLISDLITGADSSIKFFYIFGFDIGFVKSVDYFPVFPWLSLVFIGIFLGNLIFYYLKFILKLKNKFLLLMPGPIINDLRKIVKPVNFLGRHALIIYMIHSPLIFVSILILKKYFTYT